ncbi:hypothetical protein EV127DRAFT_371216 [Xylaria flabelliformis]|nr:hypothetical protein EV127DRAFT_371216 [Xylaria flabelliformis]
MDAINPFKSSGWKKAARVNCAILAVLSATLIGLSSTALSYGFKTALFFYAGSCSGRNVTTINIALHLLINVVSTLVVTNSAQIRLASSNFFMQILNSPSREEIDRAHAAGSWLDVGVSSIRNTFRLSKFKSSCWTVLFLSSVPIHLLFNSAVFRTDYRGAEFHLTIATEEFTKGAAYFPPGASLLFPGLSSVDLDEYKRDPFISNYDANGVAERYRYSDYGFQVPFSDYDDENSPVFRNISTTAKDAGQWTKLDADACKKAYASCQGLSEYRNVVLVVNKPGGWVRDDMWKLRSNESRFWDQYVPPDQPNHLFFDAQCSVQSTYESDMSGNCDNACMGALGKSNLKGFYGTYSAPDNIETDWTSYSFINISVLEAAFGNESEWGLEGYQLHHTASDFQPSALDLSIDYCLVQPIETTCRVGVAPALLLTVTLFVVIKTCTAIVVAASMGHARQEPLVTPGDAIASFITQPDVITAGYCTMSQGQIRGAFRSYSSPPQSGARPWLGARTAWASAIPKSKWATSYLFIIIGIGTCIGLLNMAISTANSSGSSITRGGFFPSNNSPIIPLNFTLVNSVLLANTPQLLLTFCYFTYNNIFTHLYSAQEWAQFGYGFFPLRVTEPKGHQVSTYRLQLPYRYSLSLMAVSIFLHWVLANTIYVLISVGGYYNYDSTLSDSSLPADAATLVGYSPTALLTLTIVSIILALIPPIWSLLTRLPPNIVVPGCNSLAISAACHVSNLSYATGKADNSNDIATPAPSAFSHHRFGKRSLGRNANYELLGDSNRESSIDDVEFEKSGENRLERIAQSKLSWGVIRMPQEWYTKHGYDPMLVEHLGFGVVKDGVAPPLWGHLYG